MKIDERPIKKWKVPSKSQQGVYHEVRLEQDGKFNCECPAGRFKAECSHIKMVKLQYENNL